MARRRTSYEQRTRSNTPAARAIAKAFCARPEVVEDADGFLVRQWKPEEMQTYTQDEVAGALKRKRAVEHNELLEVIPPSAIKYAVTKHWLKPAAVGTYYMVTDRAAADLALPRKTAEGWTIRFAKAA